jgi:hypothetical protein
VLVPKGKSIEPSRYRNADEDPLGWAQPTTSPRALIARP